MLRLDDGEVLARDRAAFGPGIQDPEQGFAELDRPAPRLGCCPGRCRRGPAQPRRLAPGDRLRGLEPVDELGKARDPLGARGPPRVLAGIAEIQAQGAPRAAKRFRVGLAPRALKGGRSAHAVTSKYVLTSYIVPH